MICFINGNDIYIRGKEWSDSEDFVWQCSKVNLFGGNHYFNLENAYTCPSNCKENDVSGYVRWKCCLDDINPVHIQGSYIGGNHGFYCVDVVLSSSHGKTQKDIGSVWKDGAGLNYCLVKVPDENTLWFVMFRDESMADGKMSFGRPKDILIHESGAVHVADVVVQEIKQGQLHPCFNQYSIHLLVDGLEQKLSEDGVLYGERISVLTKYDILYVPAVLKYLMKHVGNNTNDSLNAEEISESYMTLCVNYEFHENGSITSYHSFQIHKDVLVGQIGLVQSMAIDEHPYSYIPDTKYDTLTTLDGSQEPFFTKDIWKWQDKAPYRYYQFADVFCDKGMALAYDRSIGWGKNSLRLKHLNRAGMNYKSKKQYPYFISDYTLKAGERFEGCAVRMPLHQYDKDFTSVCWYWLGEDIILMIDGHREVDKELLLPEYMNDRKIEVLDKTDSCRSEQNVIKNRTLRIQMKGDGYLVLRLYEA